MNSFVVDVESACAGGNIEITAHHDGISLVSVDITTDRKAFEERCFVITRLVNLDLRVGLDIRMIIEELQGIGDPVNGASHLKGKQFLSFYSEVSDMLEQIIDTIERDDNG